MKISLARQISAVESYLSERESLRAKAKNLGVHYNTFWRWVKLYKQIGKKNFRKRREQRRHWNRTAKEIEDKLIFLKEKTPGLTLKRAQKILKKEGTKMSLKGIWGIWKRYGFTAQAKDNPTEFFFAPLSSEIKEVLARAKTLIQYGKEKEAAKILNALPFCPNDPILEKIPVRFLSDKRKIQYFGVQFKKIPLKTYYPKISELRKKLENKSLYYSAMLAALWELLALYWMASPEKQLNLLNYINNYTRGLRNPSIRFLLYIHRGFANAALLRMEEAKKCIKGCKQSIRNLAHPFYFQSTGDLLAHTGAYKDAYYYYQKALSIQEEKEEQRFITVKLATCKAMAGEYSKALHLLPESEKNETGVRSLFSLVRAYCAFGQGNLQDAAIFFEEALSFGEKDQLRNHLHSASLGQACVLSALGKEKDASDLVKRYLPLLKKYNMYEDVLFRSLFIKIKESPIPLNELTFPHIYLLHLIWENRRTYLVKDYNRTIQFAKNRGLLGIFHRAIVFFPDIIQSLFETGKQTGLPKVILKFPVFNQKIPVYHLKFLGNFVVFKNQQYLKTKLSLKEKAFLIHLATKACAPEKFILLNDLYRNFWPHAKNSSSLLLHLLVRLKRKLMLPGYLLGISSRYIEPRLVNQGIYFTTDYNELETLLAQAKALLRAGEWGFAKKEYLRAFSLFRGEPLKKNFDEWSLNLRHRILTQIETEAINFTKSCLEHGNKKDTRKVLEKVLKIIPDSEEIKNLLNGNWLKC